MTCQWKRHLTLTIVLATAMAGVSFGQYPGHPASPMSRLPVTQQAQLPWWETLQPLAPQMSSSQSVPQSYAYRPSEMPSSNPFADSVNRRQMPVTYRRLPQPQVTHHHQANPTSFGVQHQYAAGDGMPLADPAQQIIPTAPPLHMKPHSYYEQSPQNYWQQPDGDCDSKGKGCSTLAASQGSLCRSGWYAGAVGLIMSRDRENNLWLSYDINDIRQRVLTSHDADFNYSGGSGANIGRYFNGGLNSIEFVYWGIYPGQSEANAYWADTAGGLDTILRFDGLEYDAGTGAGAQPLSGSFFFDAERHRLQRNYNVYNFELNLLGHNFVSGCGALQLGWTAGVRYLRFDEDFLYSSDPNDTVFTGDPEELHYAIDVDNNLIGFQWGGRADYCLGTCLNLFADTKVGIYGNHISHRSRIYGATSQAFVGDAASPYFGEDLDITSSKDDFAMIGDLSIGANWYLSPCWSINAGYRLVGVHGVALSTNQVPVDYIAAIDSVRAIDSSGCLILHGAFAGINFCY